MKIDEKYEDEKFKVVDVFKHNGRVCVIVRLSVMKSSNGYYSYNGYVSFGKFNGTKELDYEDYEGLAQDGLTYAGYLGKQYKGKTGIWFDIPEDLYFFGFDTLHAWNNKENSSYEAVRRKTIELADTMIAEGI